MLSVPFTSLSSYCETSRSCIGGVMSSQTGGCATFSGNRPDGYPSGCETSHSQPVTLFKASFAAQCKREARWLRFVLLGSPALTVFRLIGRSRDRPFSIAIVLLPQHRVVIHRYHTCHPRTCHPRLNRQHISLMPASPIPASSATQPLSAGLAAGKLTLFSPESASPALVPSPLLPAQPFPRHSQPSPTTWMERNLHP